MLNDPFVLEGVQHTTPETLNYSSNFLRSTLKCFTSLVSLGS